MSRMSTASGPLSRETATKDGNTARASALATPAGRPQRGATIRYRTMTEHTPAIASGASRLSGCRPNIFALSTWTHSAIGGLSIEMNPCGSNDTNRKLCHDASSDLTPAE